MIIGLIFKRTVKAIVGHGPFAIKRCHLLAIVRGFGTNGARQFNQGPIAGIHHKDSKSTESVGNISSGHIRGAPIVFHIITPVGTVHINTIGLQGRVKLEVSTGGVRGPVIKSQPRFRTAPFFSM